MTATRLPGKGRFIDATHKMPFTFDGTRMAGHPGDTLASALLANDRVVMGRSFKYHRPRGIVASGAEEPNALVNMGEGGRFEPNQRVTTTELFDGLTATSQNHWPSLEFDVGVVNNFVEAVNGEAPLLADAAEGLHSVELANAMVYSAWTQARVTLPLDSAAYEAALEEKIATSPPRKRKVREVVLDLESSYS